MNLWIERNDIWVAIGNTSWPLSWGLVGVAALVLYWVGAVGYGIYALLKWRGLRRRGAQEAG